MEAGSIASQQTNGTGNTATSGFAGGSGSDLSAASAANNGAAAGDNDTCLQLALEGEKLCKGGNCRDGVAFFEAALQAGTDDFRTLSAIYRYDIFNKLEHTYEG